MPRIVLINGHPYEILDNPLRRKRWYCGHFVGMPHAFIAAVKAANERAAKRKLRAILIRKARRHPVTVEQR